MPTAAQHHALAHLSQQVAQITAADWQDAEDAALDDVESFANWLTAECAFAGRAKPLPYGATITDVQAASGPVLLRTAMHYSLRTQEVLVACCIGELTKRYLRESADHTHRIASEAGAADRVPA